MAADRAYQRNARDPKQRAFSDRMIKRQERRRAVCYLEMLSTQAGRYVLAELIMRSGARKSPFDPHGSIQSANIGRMELGLELDRYLQVIAPTQRHLMWKEWEELEEREGEEVDAAQAVLSTAERTQ